MAPYLVDRNAKIDRPQFTVGPKMEQLAAFSSNSRANEIMHENAKNLTPDTERQLAAFLATQ